MKKNNTIPDASLYAVSVKWDAENDGWLATVPAIPGCICVMPTEAAAMKEIRLLIRACLEIRLEDGHPIPEPDSYEVESADGVIPLLNISEVARVAGVPRATLASRIRRRKLATVPNVAVAKRLAQRLVTA